MNYRINQNINMNINIGKINNFNNNLIVINNDKNNSDLNLEQKKSNKINLKNIFSLYNPLDSENVNYEDINSSNHNEKKSILILKC